MRALLAICLLATASFALAVAPTTTVKGTVLEVKDVESYTYLRLKTDTGISWAAVSRAPVSKGASVKLENVMVMHDFESKTLRKTFPEILFGTLAGVGAAQAASPNLPAGHPPMNAAKAGMDAPVAPVAKAVGANARTVAEIVKQSAKLKDKPVLVRGKVVKYNAGIMGKNWVHLRDGSGSEADGSNDILVTTTQAAKVSDVVSVQGVVRTNKDFGAGYVYAVLIEDAKLKP